MSDTRILKVTAQPHVGLVFVLLQYAPDRGYGWTHLYEVIGKGPGVDEAIDDALAYAAASVLARSPW